MLPSQSGACAHCCTGTLTILKFWWCAFATVFLNLQTLIQDLYPQSAAALNVLCCLATSINLTCWCEESYCY